MSAADRQALHDAGHPHWIRVWIVTDTRRGWLQVVTTDTEKSLAALRRLTDRYGGNHMAGMRWVSVIECPHHQEADQPSPPAPGRRLRVRPVFAWYDLWVGLFIDRPKRRVFFFPVPCLGVVVSWGRGD